MAKFTTIAISPKTQKSLDKMKKGRDSYDDVVSRLINQSIDVYVEMVAVDNELPQLHTVVFQMGEDKESLYYFDGQQPEPIPITLKEANKLMKQPKPNMTITKEEAQIMCKRLWNIRKDMPITTVEENFHKRLQEFLEQKDE